MPVRTGRWRAGTIVPALLACAVLILSVRLGSDASWDLRNYHLYDPWAWLHKAPGTDIAPAQRQSFHNPLPDLPGLWLRFRLSRQPSLLDALLAIPDAAALVIGWFIGRTLWPDRVWLPLAALLFGASGAASLPTLGTSMSEMPSACFMLAGLLLLLRVAARGEAPHGHLPAIGLLSGIAVGLKLTQAVFVPAMLLATLAALPLPPRRRVSAMLLVAAGIVPGMLLSGGAWWLHLWRITGNPVFPYRNDLFRSPLVPPLPFGDDRFLPRGLAAHLAQPFRWAFETSATASEIPLRDPRLALALMAMALVALVLLALPVASSGSRRPGPAHRVLLVFLGAAAVLWQLQFSILRYLAPVELLCGFVVLMALDAFGRAVSAFGMAACLLLCATTTVYPKWGRVPPGRDALRILLPPLPPDAIVFLPADEPLAFVATVADPRIRFIGLRNNLLLAGATGVLPDTVRRLASDDRHPAWSLENAGSFAADAGVLAGFGLRRAGKCSPIDTTLTADRLVLCPLQHLGRASSPPV
ncbi:hypothetical protein [Rhizosaccharibacter radicis]|uniref:Glycosyltransferase RgtA/B/C/D-like domain-containing protein n=1 Tax=Rhizosaccharibacter radicis TaxID=2782605 RepID=A0ABT1VWY3_9PROT|nr:hypothetical protein [Acetobacteraceae bacterium KSS12]